MPEHKLEGKSLVPVINSESKKTQHSHFNWQMSNQWVVREGNWKLCSNIVDTTGQKRVTEKGLKLYDISKDPSEKSDLSSQNKDVVERLTKIHEDWVKTWK